MIMESLNGSKNTRKPFLDSLLRHIFIIGLFILPFVETAAAESMLWEVQSPTATVYLLGSIHIAKPDLYPLDPVIENSFEKSSSLVLEANILEVDQTALLQRILTEGSYTGNKTIKDELTVEVYGMLEEHFKKVGLPVTGFINLKPAILALVLESLEYTRLGLSPENGIDLYFARKANGTKPILELESIQQQMDLILNMPDSNLLLKYTLMDISSFAEQFDLITNLWIEGNANKLNELLIVESLRKYPELITIMDAIIFHRNQKMAEKIQTYLGSDRTYFVVVGAGHLVGDRSIVKYLEKAGYSVRKH